VLHFKELTISAQLKTVKLINPTIQFLMLSAYHKSLCKCVSFHLASCSIPINTRMPMMDQVVEGELWL
jgi:hypothetical protein